MKLEFFSQIFEKYSNIKSLEYLSSGNRVIPYRHEEDNNRFLQFCECAYITFRKMYFCSKLHAALLSL